MASCTFDLPADLYEKLKARAAESGYSDAGGYVRDLVAEDVSDESDGPPHLRIGTDEELEEELVRRMGPGKTIEVTPEYWANLETRLNDRLRGGKS